MFAIAGYADDVTGPTSSESETWRTCRALPRMERVWADRGYNGRIGEWIKQRLGWPLQIVKPPRRWG
jgi:hypothetical protein